jgi:SAM-dependent MidA family methyltransferase
LPERLDRYMARSNAAYYATHDPFADFTTAPEISQTFGELLGAWAAIVWQMMGTPDPVLLVEAGPGRGTLMADMLRTASRVATQFHAAARVHFIETSPRLRAQQARAVPNAHFAATLADLPEGPAILIANEFLDALPIRQFVARNGLWLERHVNGTEMIELPAQEGPAAPPADGEEAELCEPALAFVQTLAARLSAQGGAALILDYGPAEQHPRNSLQAVHAGQPVPPLSVPAGEADLTAHVDFPAIAAAARQAGAMPWGPVPQGVFLSRLGIAQRAERLAAANPTQRAHILNAAQRLASPTRMGGLFKALCIAHPALGQPPGFET